MLKAYRKLLIKKRCTSLQFSVIILCEKIWNIKQEFVSVVWIRIHEISSVSQYLITITSSLLNSSSWCNLFKKTWQEYHTFQEPFFVYNIYKVKKTSDRIFHSKKIIFQDISWISRISLNSCVKCDKSQRQYSLPLEWIWQEICLFRSKLCTLGRFWSQSRANAL